MFSCIFFPNNNTNCILSKSYGVKNAAGVQVEYTTLSFLNNIQNFDIVQAIFLHKSEIVR